MSTQVEKDQKLSGLYEQCYRAYSGTSFSPERRAANVIREYSSLLDSDLAELGDNAGNYRAKFEEKFGAWMSAKSNCISSMITGGSNFPVRRAQKANERESNRYNDFIQWRERYFKAVNRVPTKSPEEELELAEKKHEALLNFQLEMKEANAAARKLKNATISEVRKELAAQGFEVNIIRLFEERGGKVKIPSFYLTNNNARIKNTADKIKMMETRIERKDSWEDIVFDGGRVTIEDDRVKIFHDEKPAQEVRDEIKRNGFRWSPFWGCWCRKHTGNAIYTTKQLSFIKQ